MLMSGRVDPTTLAGFMELRDESGSVNHGQRRGFLLRSNHREDAVASPLSERDSLRGMLPLPLSCLHSHVQGKSHFVPFLRLQTHFNLPRFCGLCHQLLGNAAQVKI